MCNGTVNYTAGGTGKGQRFPRSLVAVERQWEGGGGIRGPMYLGQGKCNTEPISLSLLPHSSL